MPSYVQYTGADLNFYRVFSHLATDFHLTPLGTVSARNNLTSTNNPAPSRVRIQSNSRTSAAPTPTAIHVVNACWLTQKNRVVIKYYTTYYTTYSQLADVPGHRRTTPGVRTSSV